MAPKLVKFRASNKRREGLRVCAHSCGSSLSFGRWLQVDEIWQRFRGVAGSCSTQWEEGQMPMDALAGPRGTSWMRARGGYARSREPSLHFHGAERVA